MKNNKELAIKRGQRLKTALEEYGMIQADITRDGKITESQVSDWVSGKVCISDRTLKDIIEKHLKEVRLEYLLGYDNYLTEEQKRLAIDTYAWNRTDSLFCIINNSFKMQGYQLKLCVVGKSCKGYKPTHKDGYYILKYPEDTSKESLKILSLEDYFRLEEEIEQFSEYLTQKIVHRFSEEEHKEDSTEATRNYIKKWIKEDLSSEEINKRLNMIQEGMTEEDIKTLFENL